LFVELPSDEAYTYLRNVNSGHPGSITSVHASSAALAFEQLLHSLIDVVVQFGLEKQRRYISEVVISR